MPRTKEQFEAMRRATREKILAAAGGLFAKKGPAGTSVQEIADLAGISIGLLYRHFQTKEELFDALVDGACEGLAEVTAILQTDTPPKEIIEGLCAEILSDVGANDDYNNLIMLITQAIGSGSKSEALTVLFEQDKQMLLALEQLIERGQTERVFRAGNPYDMALLFCSTLQGISQFRMLLKDDYKPPSPHSLSSLLVLY